LVALGERTTPNGQELLAEFIQYGHQRPFEEIVRRYAGMVFNVCYRITKDKHEAEDATQAVFLTLALQAKRGTDIKALGPWLQQVAKRLSLDTRRSKKRRQTREERHEVEQTARRESLLDDTLPSADLDELKTILHEELQKLPAKYRLPLILHYFGGLSREEMAAELNCKPSTLGVRIFRGREMLAGRLTSRGIHISGAMLATLMGYIVKRAVSDTLIASTSHAATAMLAGHDGAGLASAHVIGLTRRATGALALGKVRIAAISLMIAGSSLGAGAKALGVLPQIDVRQMIVNQINRMVRPLLSPLSRPLRVDSQVQPVKTTVAAARPTPAEPPVDLSELIATSNPPLKTTVKPATETAPSDGRGIVIGVTSAPIHSAWTGTPTVANRFDNSIPAMTKASEGPTSDKSSVQTTDESDTSVFASASGGGGGTAGAADYHIVSPLPAAAPTQSSFHAPDFVFASNNLYVGSASVSQGHSTSSSSSVVATATPASIIQIPAIGGSVTETSTGIIRGWGIINRTGTLQNNGMVVADGEGVDRTLNLTSFAAVQTSSPVTTPAAKNTATPATPSLAANVPAISAPVAYAAVASSSPMTTAPVLQSNPVSASINASPLANASFMLATSPVSPELCGDGWYAIDHGRLSLPLTASSSDPSVLTWGDDPNAVSLSLVNSVRISLADAGATSPVATAAVPADLSLLSDDRSDVPDRFAIGGAPIGLWQVDPNGPDLASVDLTINYNAVLADALGASPSSVQLWTYSDNTDAWQTASSFSLDTTDHLVSGSGTDISYFAVSVTPAPGQDVEDVLANHLDQFSGQPSGGTQVVPEPLGLPLLILGAGLLGRRRRRDTV